MHRDKPAVPDGFAQIIDKVGVEIDHQQRRIGSHPFEHRLAKGADAGAVFDEQLGIIPIDRSQHLFDRTIR